MDNLNTFATKQQMTNNELIQLSENREDWRTLIIDACTRPDTSEIEILKILNKIVMMTIQPVVVMIAMIINLIIMIIPAAVTIKVR